MKPRTRQRPVIDPFWLTLASGALAALLLGAALGGAFYRFTPDKPAMDASTPTVAEPPRVGSKRPLPEIAPSNADLSSAKPARNALDFVGPESDGPSIRRLSAAVRAEEWETIEAVWRAGDFSRAAQLAAALSEFDDRRLILLPLLADWAAMNPKQAARFAQERPAGVERSELLETTIRAWAERDVAAASAWLDALASEPDHDRAVVAIATCEVLLQRRPEIALSWAESVGAPSLRWEAICTVAQDWARRDRQAAERYVETCEVLTPAEREQMLAHLRRWAVAVK